MDPTFHLAVFGDLSGWHLLIVLLIALLLFGHKLPDVMRNLGGSVREFKKGMNTDDPKPPEPPADTAPRGAKGPEGKDQPPTTPK